MQNSLKLNVDKFIIFLFIFGVIVLDNGSLAMRLIKVVVVTYTFIMVLKRKKFSMNAYIIWSFIFTFYVVVSIFWATYESTAIDAVQTLALNFMCIYAFIQFVRQDTKKIDYTYILIGSLSLIYMLRLIITYGSSIISTGLRNVDNAATSMHNNIGMYAAFAICFLIILKGDNKHNKQLLYTILIILNLGCIILSGSRKSFIFLALPIAIYYCLKNKNPIRLIKNAGIILIGIYLLYIFIMKNTYLYNMVGEGANYMISGILGKDTDASTAGRLRVINWGLQIFNAHPMFGYGLENFKMLHLNSYGVLMIADNNYVELLVDTGVIGLILYYSFHIIFLFNLFKYRQINILDAEINMFIGIEFAILVCDYGTCSYKNLYIQVLMALGWIILKSKKAITDNGGAKII